MPFGPLGVPADLFVFEPVAQDAVHVLVQPLQPPVARPHVGVVAGHQALHCGLQTGQQLPVFPPGDGGRDRGKQGEQEREESELEQMISNN